MLLSVCVAFMLSTNAEDAQKGYCERRSPQRGIINLERARKEPNCSRTDKCSQDNRKEDDLEATFLSVLGAKYHPDTIQCSDDNFCHHKPKEGVTCTVRDTHHDTMQHHPETSSVAF